MIVPNTLIYSPAPRYTDLATNTTLATATRHDTAAFTITIKETGTRTFRSVRLRAQFQDRFTVANAITGVRMGITLGAAAVSDTDRSFVQANTGDHSSEIWDLDVTSYFVANFGAGQTQTCVCSLAVSTTTASDIGGTIWFQLEITYDYDNTTGTERTKSIPIPIQGHHTFLTAGAMVEIGTAGVLNAPANQMPALDTYLEEAGKTYHQTMFVWHANCSTGATGCTPSIQIDAGAVVAQGLIGRALDTARVCSGLYDMSALATNVAHAIKAQTDVASTLIYFGGIVWVTYSYTIAGTARATYFGIVPIEEQGSIDASGPQRFLDMSATAGDREIYEAFIDVQEPGAITTKQCAIVEMVHGVSGGTLSMAAGGQVPTYRVAGGGTGISSWIYHRADHSAGWAIARGSNRLSVHAFTSIVARIVMNGYAVIVYSADVPAVGVDRGNCALGYLNAVYGTVLAQNTITAAAGQRVPVLAAPWRLSSVMMSGVVRGTASTQVPSQLAMEIEAGEFQGAGWAVADNIGAGQLTELMCVETQYNVSARHYRDSIALAALEGAKMDPNNARRIGIISGSGGGTLLYGISTRLTWHAVTYTVGGFVTVGGAAVANGKTVKVYDSTNGRYLGSTLTTGGTGAFALPIPYNTSNVFATYVDGGNNGRSADGNAGAISHDIVIPGGAGDATPPVITIVSPTPGVAPGAPGGFPADLESAKATPIVLQLTDAGAGLRYACIVARFHGSGTEEVVYRRGTFRGGYAVGSSSSAIAGGLQLSVKRLGGWPGSSNLDDVSFEVDLLDAAGNLAP